MKVTTVMLMSGDVSYTSKFIGLLLLTLVRSVTLNNCSIIIKLQVGKGQFSEVYKARLHIDMSIVALKKVQVNSFKLCRKLGLYFVFLLNFNHFLAQLGNMK